MELLLELKRPPKDLNISRMGAFYRLFYHDCRPDRDLVIKMTIDHANDDDDMLDAVAADAFEPFEVLAGASMGNYRAAYSPHNAWLLCNTTTLLDFCSALYTVEHCKCTCRTLHCTVRYIAEQWRARQGKGQGGWL